jgi:signal transduction histidine kinase
MFMREEFPFSLTFMSSDLSNNGQAMFKTTKPSYHPLNIVALLTIGLVLWAVGVYFYQINNFMLFDPEIWWFKPKDIFNVPFLVDSTIAAFREQWVPLIVLAAASFLPVVKRSILGRLEGRDSLNLFLLLAFVQTILVAQIFYLDYREIDFSTFGVFFVVVAGLLGGWRMGVQIGLVHLLLFGGIFYYDMVVRHDSSLSYIRMMLTELHLLAPIWAGVVAGYLGEPLGLKRFNWPFVLTVGVVAELVLVLVTMISSWSPVEYVHRYLSHFLATPLMFLGFCWLVHYHLSSSDGKLRMTQTDLALAEAELKALRAQINPHFMVNSLSVIHHLVRTQPDVARDLLLDLSDLFQHSLRSGDFVPLRQELEHVRAYLALEQARLTKRLNVMWAVLAEDKLDTPVPTLILQPIIENAIVHGISPKPEGGTVSILVKQAGDNLHIQVADNGVGFNVEHLQQHSDRPSIGIKNVDFRLKLLYGEAYRLQIDSTPGAGTTMEFKIPLVQEIKVAESTELVVK